MTKNLYVTQPALPALDEFVPYLEQIWDSRIITNGGPFHQQLERALSEYLGVQHISLFSNGTIGLVTALQALNITGEVITTPFSFVATAHSLMWNGLKPVFVDIAANSLNLDPSRIEAAITERTTAILPVHCYGSPCDVDAIQRIADKHGLKVIYDAAHAFGVRHDGQSLLNYGDLSVLSFHATKVFNTFEGGAVISPDAQTKQRIDQLKNFGFVDETTVVEIGINGKMSEINAAFGLVQLRHVDEAIARRREIDERYRKQLQGVKGIRLIEWWNRGGHNYSYFPILVEPAFPLSRDALYAHLRAHHIYSRRYFYPLISDFPMYRGFSSASPENLPVAQEIAKKVLCLPIYPALKTEEQQLVIDTLLNCR